MALNEAGHLGASFQKQRSGNELEDLADRIEAISEQIDQQPVHQSDAQRAVSNADATKIARALPGRVDINALKHRIYQAAIALNINSADVVHSLIEHPQLAFVLFAKLLSNGRGRR